MRTSEAPAAALDELAGPWTRFFARVIDVALPSRILVAVLATAFFFADPPLYLFVARAVNPLLLLPISLPLVAAFNAVLITLFGNTLGKAILGIKTMPVHGTHGFRLLDNLSRELRVWLLGCGLGIPFVFIVTMWLAFRRVCTGQPTAYDAGRARVVAVSKGRFRRGAGILLALTLSGATLYLGVLAQQRATERQQTTRWTNPETSKATVLPAGWTYIGASGGADRSFTSLRISGLAVTRYWEPQQRSRGKTISIALRRL